MPPHDLNGYEVTKSQLEKSLEFYERGSNGKFCYTCESLHYAITNFDKIHDEQTQKRQQMRNNRESKINSFITSHRSPLLMS